MRKVTLRVGVGAMAVAAVALVVAADEGVEGELRIRKVRVVAGEPKTRTEHIEFGLRYLVDVDCWSEVKGQPIKPSVVAKVLRAKLKK